MELLIQGRHLLLSIAMVVLAAALLLTLIRAMLGPRFTDRIVAVNMISTQTIMIICILAFLIGEQYLVDIALVYALTSFMAVVALTNLYLSRIRARAMQEAEEQKLMESEHTIEMISSAQKSDSEPPGQESGIEPSEPPGQESGTEPSEPPDRETDPQTADGEEGA